MADSFFTRTESEPPSVLWLQLPETWNGLLSWRKLTCRLIM
jgi:hypothetical protein